MTKVAKKAAAARAKQTAAAPKKTAAKNGKAATGKPAAKKAADGGLNITGVRKTLLDLMLRKGGVSHKEGCKVTGWKVCSGTISTIIAEAVQHGYVCTKPKVDGEIRYTLAAPGK